MHAGYMLGGMEHNVYQVKDKSSPKQVSSSNLTIQLNQISQTNHLACTDTIISIYLVKEQPSHT